MSEWTSYVEQIAALTDDELVEYIAEHWRLHDRRLAEGDAYSAWQHTKRISAALVEQRRRQ